MSAAWGPDVFGVLKDLQGPWVFAGSQDRGDAMAHDLTCWAPGVPVRLRVEVDRKRFEPFDAIHGSIVTSTLAVFQWQARQTFREFFHRHTGRRIGRGRLFCATSS